MPQIEEKRHKAIGILINTALILVAASSWVSYKFSDYFIPITVAAGIITIGVSLLAFGISTSSKVGEDCDGDSAVGQAESKVANSEDGEMRAPQTALENVLASLSPSPSASLDQHDHQDVYWKIISQIAPHGHHYVALGKVEEAGSFALTMNIVNFYIDPEKKSGSATDSPIDIILRPDLSDIINLGETEH